jgi:hypothetical protein
VGRGGGGWRRGRGAHAVMPRTTSRPGQGCAAGAGLKPGYGGMQRQGGGDPRGLAAHLEQHERAVDHVVALAAYHQHAGHARGGGGGGGRARRLLVGAGEQALDHLRAWRGWVWWWMPGWDGAKGGGGRTGCAGSAGCALCCGAAGGAGARSCPALPARSRGPLCKGFCRALHPPSPPPAHTHTHLLEGRRGLHRPPLLRLQHVLQLGHAAAVQLLQVRLALGLQNGEAADSGRQAARQPTRLATSRGPARRAGCRKPGTLGAGGRALGAGRSAPGASAPVGAVGVGPGRPFPAPPVWRS